MNRSENITTLAKALARFHAHAPAIIKNAENPHYRNAYANLGGILDAIRTPLADVGLSVLQLLGDTNITTMLLHESGEFLETTTPLIITKMDAQGYGSSVSYQRRYSLSALLSLAALDDDGQAACTPAKKFHNSPAPAPAPETKAEKIVRAKAAIAEAQQPQEVAAPTLMELMERDKVTDEQVFEFLDAKGAKTGDSLYIGDLSKGIHRRLVEVWDEVKAFTPVTA